MIYLQLFWEFFKTGLFSIGGGLATLPFLYDMAEITGWFTNADIANMLAISESTPGPLGVNMATYVGFHSAGVMGAVAAALGLISPSIMVILIIARVLEQFKESTIVKDVFYGLRPASTALIAIAAYEVARIALLSENPVSASLSGVFAVFQWKAVVLALVLFIATKKLKLHPVVFIVASAIIGVVFQF